LVGLLGKPEIEVADELGIHLHDPPSSTTPMRTVGAANRGELILQRPELLPVGFQAEGAGKPCLGFFDIDVRRTGADSFGEAGDEYD
jgi:hypothetical protein